LIVDDHERHTFGAQALDHGLSHAAVSAYDVMVPHTADMSFHFFSPEEVAHAPSEHNVPEQGEGIDECSHSGQDENNREQLTPGGKGLYLTKTDGEDGDDGHVEAVQEWPAFQDVVSDGADQDHKQDEQQRFPHFPDFILHEPPAAHKPTGPRHLQRLGRAE